MAVHGVELVALEWFQGPGRGILRVTIDHPGGDPRVRDPARSVSLDEVTAVTRDVSAAMDALDLVPGPYTLEVGSPGTERPVQKREDFDRFAGLTARLEVREPNGGKKTIQGILRGTVEQPTRGFAVRIEVGGQIQEVAAERIVRARLREIKPSAGLPSAKNPSRRRERWRAGRNTPGMDAEHPAARAAPEDFTPEHEGRSRQAISAPTTHGGDDHKATHSQFGERHDRGGSTPAAKR